MSLGNDIANAFVAGYQIAPSQLDNKRKQAEIDSANASTAEAQARTAAIPETTAAQLKLSAAQANAADASAGYTSAETAALPARIKYEQAQADRAEKMGDYYALRGNAADVAAQAAATRADAAQRVANGKDPAGIDWSDSDATLSNIFGITPQTKVPVEAPASAAPTQSSISQSLPPPASAPAQSAIPAPASAIPDAPDANSYLAVSSPPPAPKITNPDDATTAVGAATAQSNRTASPLEAAPPAKLDPTNLSAGLIAGAKDLSQKAGVEGAVPTADVAKAVDDYHAGVGAMPAGMFSQILQKVDPQNVYPVGTKAAIAISQIMESPDMSPAEKAHYAGQLLQTARLGFNQYAMIANEAGKNGKITDALQAAAHAYNMIPSGMTVTAVNVNKDTGAYEIAMRNDQTGEVTTQPLMSPSDVAAGKLHITPQMFDQMLSDTMAAGQPTDKTALPAADQAAIADLGKTGQFDGSTYAGLSEKGRAAYDTAYQAMNKEGEKTSDAATSVDAALSTIKTALTAPNMNMGSTTDAFAKNEGELKSNLTKWFRTDGKADPTIAGNTIANILVPTAFSSGQYSVKEGDKVATVTNNADGSTVDLPLPIWRNVQQTRAIVQKNELQKLNANRTFAPTPTGPDDRTRPALSFGEAQRAGALASTQPRSAIPVR